MNKYLDLFQHTTHMDARLMLYLRFCINTAKKHYDGRFPVCGNGIAYSYQYQIHTGVWYTSLAVHSVISHQQKSRLKPDKT